MPKKKQKKSRKTVKYKTITLKVTARQKKSLDNFCKSRRTTVNKMIKKSIRPLLEKYADLQVSPVQREKVSQLELF